MSEKLKIGVWEQPEKDDEYGLIDCFSKGFYHALSKHADFIPFEEVEKGTPINAMFSFGTIGAEYWETILKSNLRNIVWSNNSVFYKNFELYDKYADDKNFLLLDSVPSDKNSLTEYMPTLKHCNYFPQAVDLNFWKFQEFKKENDIVFLGSIIDLEEKNEVLKQKYPEDLLKIIYEMKKLSLAHPEQEFWNIYNAAKECFGLELEKGMYHEIFSDLADICETEQRIKMIQALSKFNVKVYGKGPWEKYINGSVQYCGQCSLKDSVEIINKSKISLHIQPMKYSCGLHERFLNASAVKTFTLMGQNKLIEENFKESFGYFNSSDFSDIADMASDYLRHDEERMEKAVNANALVNNFHTWDNRAIDFIMLFRD